MELPQNTRHTRRGGNGHRQVQTMSQEKRLGYTLKQACQVLAVDSKTLHSWMKKLAITPVPDERDQRVRLITADDMTRLSTYAQEREEAGRGVPKANTPLGGYIRTVKHLEAELAQVRAQVDDQTEALRLFNQAQTKCLDALQTWTELVSRSAQSTSDQPAPGVAQQSEVDVSGQPDTTRLENTIGVSFERLVELALALDSVTKNIDHAKALETAGRKLLDEGSR